MESQVATFKIKHKLRILYDQNHWKIFKNVFCLLLCSGRYLEARQELKRDLRVMGAPAPAHFVHHGQNNLLEVSKN